MMGEGTGPERLLVCFDYEGAHGMPYAEDYDLVESTQRILATLAEHDAHGVFFVVGRLVYEQPDVIRTIAEAGHEIGLHGYHHEHLDRLTEEGLAAFDRDLTRVQRVLEDLTGVRPRCFRAPYLLEPSFYRKEINDILRRQGYLWISNLELRHPVEIFRPDAGPRWRRAWRRGRDGRPRISRSRLATFAINVLHVSRLEFGGSLLGRLRWLASSRAPFLQEGLLEVPVFAPLDCDLVGLPLPRELTPSPQMEYARAAIRSLVRTPAPLAMMTFHDWIVTGGNRIELLRELLVAAREAGLLVDGLANGRSSPSRTFEATLRRPA
ncbi:MAG TPA: polysaccharide deacetylase family protein [Kineosporiaceae bacterium]